jgi:hypothetical protein
MRLRSNSVRRQALALVERLLEGDPPKKIARLLTNPKPAQTPAPGTALHPSLWFNFATRDEHAWERYDQRVEEAYQADFLLAWFQMKTTRVPIPVPETTRWGLKMPHGYTIAGEGVEGKTIIGRKQALPCPVVLDNPCIDPRWNQSWQASRNAL